VKNVLKPGNSKMIKLIDLEKKEFGILNFREKNHKNTKYNGFSFCSVYSKHFSYELLVIIRNKNLCSQELSNFYDVKLRDIEGVLNRNLDNNTKRDLSKLTKIIEQLE